MYMRWMKRSSRKDISRGADRSEELNQQICFGSIVGKRRVGHVKLVQLMRSTFSRGTVSFWVRCLPFRRKSQGVRV